MTDWEHFLLYAVAAIAFFGLARDDEESTFTVVAMGVMGFGCLIVAVYWLLRDWGVVS